MTEQNNADIKPAQPQESGENKGGKNWLRALTLLFFVSSLCGLFIISAGSYFYIKSAFGTGPRDSLMVVLAKKTKMPAGVCRSIIELSVTIAGWFLGGMAGLGTIIAVIGIGFCIQITFKLFKFDVTAVRHESLRDTFVLFAGNRNV